MRWKNETTKMMILMICLSKKSVYLMLYVVLQRSLSLLFISSASQNALPFVDLCYVCPS
jgi:hypothetical protein